MEMFQLPKFDLTADNLEGSLGLTDKRSHYVKASILFECLACPIMAEEFFDRESDIPQDMKTMPGIMQRAFSHMRDGIEQMYFTMIFMRGYEHLYDAVNMVSERGLVKESPQAIKDMISSVTNTPADDLVSVINRIKRNNFDFDKFIALTIAEDRYDEMGNFVPKEITEESQKEVDDYIANLLKKAQENKRNNQGNKEDGEDNSPKDNN